MIIFLKKMQGISWPTVCYMLGEAQYGGRVTDDFDKRLLSTFTQLWFSERLLQPGFEFYKNYALPPTTGARTLVGTGVRAEVRVWTENEPRPGLEWQGLSLKLRVTICHAKVPLPPFAYYRTSRLCPALPCRPPSNHACQ